MDGSSTTRSADTRPQFGAPTDLETDTARTVHEGETTGVMSGDGRWVAYSKRADDRFQVFLWDRTTGTEIDLSSSELNSSYPTISDDGSVVAWRDSPRNIGDTFTRVWQRSTGAVTDLPTNVGVPELSGNGEYLFYAPSGVNSVRRNIATGSEIDLPFGPANVADDGESFVYARPNPGFAAANGIGVHVIARPGDVNEITIEDDFGIGPQNVLISGDGSTVFVLARPDLSPLDVNESFDTYRWIPATGSLDWLADRSDIVYDVSVDGSIVAGAGPAAQNENGKIYFRSTMGEPEVPAEVPDSIAVADLAKPQLTDQVARLYEAFFLRTPDPQGLAFWTERRSNGWSVSRMADNFVQSPEFVDRYGELTDAEFIELIYRNLFDRAPDASGGPFWSGQLAAGTSRGAVMVEFSESAEYISVTGTSTPSPPAAHQIWRLYRAYFGRDADQAGFDFWYATQATGRPLDSISDAFAASAEFIEKYGALSDTDFVDLIYRDVLDRAAEAEGRAFWIDQLDSGRSRGSVMTAFSESAEYIRQTQTLPA